MLNASTESELEAAFAKVIELHARGLVIGGVWFFTSHSKQLAALAARYRVPAVYQWREFAATGGLMSYGSNVTETHRLLGLLYRPHSEGRQAGRSTGATSNEY